MNYDERIAALEAFKTAVSSGSTTDNVSGTSSDVSGWEGDAKPKFDDYIEEVKSDSKSIAGKKASFLTDVDGQITAIQTQLETEVNLNKFVATSIYDSKDSSKNKSLRRAAVNNLSVDESVKKRLLKLI
ncbi:hypothetical protein [Streptococcus pantholopis]|uniref:Uncharacterized protein n=1 Tax=Streptococcus pantholopis TaxID=1811193 RepID=A0A172Q972_9STRE|nr:hypothetical protein [Streptococcus pantholopis]AND80014.1 hypothetical protein A0O21_08365 [Streptococcus pantholopis]